MLMASTNRFLAGEQPSFSRVFGTTRREFCLFRRRLIDASKNLLYKHLFKLYFPQKSNLETNQS